MKKKRFLLVVVGLVCVMALTIIPFSGCPAPTTPTPTPTTPTPTPTTPTPTVEKPTYNWRWTNCWGIPIENEVSEKFIDELARLSDGRIVVELYPGMLLGDYSLKIKEIAKGTIEGGNECLSTELDPRINLVTIPYMVFSYEGAEEAFSTGGAIHELFSDVCEDVGWKLLGGYTTGFNHYLFVDDLFTPTPDEVRPLGLKTRTMLMKTDEDVTNILGFIAVPMPRAEVESAMATGVIDGRGGMVCTETYLFVDLAEYMYMYFVRPELEPFIMNLELFNSLSAEDQQIVQEAANTAIAYGWEILPEFEDEGIQVGIDGGIEFIYLTDEQMAINVRAVREQLWPDMDVVIGTTLMDAIRDAAEPIPGG